MVPGDDHHPAVVLADVAGALTGSPESADGISREVDGISREVDGVLITVLIGVDHGNVSG
jgi:hypothetical protein